MILPASYHSGFAPRDGRPLYPSLWTGCIGVWAPCLGPTGTTLYDWSGLGRRGTLTNFNIGTAWTAGQHRYSILTDGTDDNVSLASGSAGAIYEIGSGDFTIAFWASNTSSGSYRGVLGNMVQWNPGILIGKTTSQFGCYIGSTTENNSGYAIPSDGTWHHYVIRRYGSSCKFVVDGIERNSFTNSNSLAGTNPTLYGFAAGFTYWSGNLGTLSVHSRALLASEITLLSQRQDTMFLLSRTKRYSTPVAFNRRRRLLIGANH